MRRRPEVGYRAAEFDLQHPEYRRMNICKYDIIIRLVHGIRLTVFIGCSLKGLSVTITMSLLQRTVQWVTNI